MKKFFLLLVLAALASGCAVKYQTPHGVAQHTFWQRGIMLMVTHTCSDRGRLYQAGRGLVAVIIGSRPQNVPLDPFSPGDYQIHVTFESLDEKGNAIGIASATFQIDNRSTTAQTWVITNSRNSTVGGGRRTQCSQ